MKVTDAFLGEHGVFYAQFDRLEQTLPEASSVEEIRRDAQVLGASLHTHAHLENELLLDPFLAGEGGDALQVMRDEHDEIGELLDEIEQSSDVEQARSLFLSVIQTARDHFAKEEAMLFPFAERNLSEAELVAKGREWARQRNVELG